MNENTNQAFFHVPTLAERIRRRLGFRYHLGDEPEGHEALEGWMRTDIRLRFGWLDRLRLLATGQLFIASIVHTDTPSPAICKSRVDWMIQSQKERSGIADHRMSRRPEWGALLLGAAWILGGAAMQCRTDDEGFLFIVAAGGIVALGALDLLTMRWGRR